ncbi:MAG: nuclear transport factor 2 family protein [Bacteroidia bacterium]|nr:nuclear transport factor 2 family protein [Bacteroidia bacterium]MBT8278139.1 nuclear transport factor 2 family protein [Bacteroidia bacterium]NND26735.1 nuclear transport factor 2 family protein [Flavobacteriaceae bacterium]NNK61339.1 nuclear transport factor 2 family protein [Flavobacteriaceae bacterium]
MKSYIRISTMLCLLSCLTVSHSQTQVTELSPNEKWMQAINDNPESLESLYSKNAIVISNTGDILKSRDEILEAVLNSDFKVQEVSTIKIIEANANYDYEIGSFKNKDGELMKHFIIWKTSGDTILRELEFLAEASLTDVNIEDINTARAAWMSNCNANDANALIENVYSENTLYYNRGRLLMGRSDLITEYQYMNNPSYKLTLNPLHVEVVNDSIVFEIGQCKGSYNGKYMLVWKKNKAGKWQVLFDSNI